MKNFLILLPLILGFTLVADDKKEQETPVNKKEEPKKEDPKKGKTHKVTRDTFKLEFELDGTFMNPNAREVSIETKSWGLLNVLNALPQGALVKKGQRLITLDFEKIDEKIRDLRFEQELVTLDLQVAEAELKLMEVTSPIELKALERKNNHVKEDLKRYREIQRPRQEKAAEVSLKSARDSLAYAEEELKQLRKMYEADDLTEETEEIILQRAESAVEKAKFYLEGAEIKKEETLKISIPRASIEAEENARQSELNLKTSRKTHPVTHLKKSIAVKKLRLQLENVKENLARLQADRAKMHVPAPISGTLFRGTMEKGKWSGSAGLDPRMRKGGTIKPNEIFMTIVPGGQLSIHTTAPEKHLLHMVKGLQAEVRPTIDPDMKMKAVVGEVSLTPIAPGNHGVTMHIKLEKDSPIRAGMTAKLKFVPYLNKEALWVPKGALFEEKEPGSYFVYIHRADRKPKKVNVEPGIRSGEKVEILKGLRAGAEILLEKPGK